MRRQVLLIEDDPLYRSSIKLLFDGEPYHFFEAESPEEGIKLLEEKPEVRVVMLDLSFDSSAGRNVLEFLGPRIADYRVIVLTGHDELLPAEEAEEHKVFHYLPKAERSASQSIRFTVDLAFRDLEREHLSRKTQFLLEIQERINENQPLPGILDLLCRRVLDMVGGYTCHIRVYDFQKGDFHLQGFAGANDGVRGIFAKPRAKGELFSGAVVADGKPLQHDDLQALPSYQDFAKRGLEEKELSPEEAEYWKVIRSAYIVPLSTGLYEKEVDAVLNVSSDRVAFFDESKREAVDEFVIQAKLAITKEWLRLKRAEAHDDYGAISKMLGDMSGELKEGPDLSGVFEVVTRKISDLVRPELVSIFLYDETTDLLYNVAELRGNEPNRNPHEFYKPGQSLTGSVFSQNRAIQRPPLEGTGESDDPIVFEQFDRADLERLPSGDIRHYLGVPIRVDGRPRGVLRAVNKKSEYYNYPTARNDRFCLLERGFSLDCRNVLEITASHLSVAIRNSELIQEKERQLNQIRTLGEVGRLINSALDIREVLRLTMHEMARVMQAEICMLFLKNGEDRVTLEESFGLPRIEGAHYLLGQGVTGQVAQNGESHLLVDGASRNDGRYDVEIRKFLTEKHGRETEIESEMVVPIKTKSTILGVLKVINKVGDRQQYNKVGDRQQYNRSDLELFKTFADYVGVAIENGQIYKNLSLLVSSVAHEINNTSGVIPANVDGVRTYLGETGPQIQGMLDLIEDAASQATDFANEIAGFSARGMEGKQPLDINEVIKATLDAIELSRFEVSSSFEPRLTFSEDGLICEVYERPFSQIVRNIVINALQALGRQSDGELAVSTARSVRDGVGFAVLGFRDNGPGIKPEHKSRIFEAEFTTRSRGNGVGLWLVRTQLQQVGGTIEVESEYGKGTHFTVCVPLAKSVASGGK